MYYQMMCGCQLERKDLIRTKATKERLDCPTHPWSRIVIRFTFCKICGVRRTFAPSNGRPSLYCAEHQKEQNKSAKIKEELEPEPVKITRNMYAGEVDLDRRAHCIHRMDCLTEYSKFYDVPCKSCEKFERKTYSHDGYENHKDFNPELEVAITP